MTCINCGQRTCCTTLAVVASLIIGIITAFLRFSAIITLTPAFLWVVFGIAIVYLGITAVVSAIAGSSGIRNCVCQTLTSLVLGVLGTILFSLILLGVTFAATSVIGAIFSGLLLGFFSLFITSSACIIKCLSGCNE